MSGTAAGGVIAWHTVANVYYLLRKSDGKEVSRRFIHDLLEFVEILAFRSPEARAAAHIPPVEGQPMQG